MPRSISVLGVMGASPFAVLATLFVASLFQEHPGPARSIEDVVIRQAYPSITALRPLDQAASPRDGDDC
jgi:hypothetical protein